MWSKYKYNLLLLTICLVLTITILGVLFIKPDGNKFIEPPFATDAITGTPDVPTNLAYMPLEVEPGYTVQLCGNLANVDQKVAIYFTSPRSNEVWLSLKVMEEDGELLGKTDLIKPGEYIKEIHLLQDVVDNTKVILSIDAYEPKTYVSKGKVNLSTVIRK